MNWSWIVLAGAIGALVGAVELLTRYRDDPFAALRNLAAVFYLAVNGAASMIALLLLARYAASLFDTGGSFDPLLATLAAGLSALAALRTSIFRVRTAGGEDIAFGPALLIESLLKVVDRSVDRHLAEQRARIVKELAPQLNFTQHGNELALHCISLLQNANLEEQTRITALAANLVGRADITPIAKSRLLVLGLLGVIGEPVLRGAVRDVTEAAP